MGRTQKKVTEDEKPQLHKTMSPESRENMMISLAMDNAEEQLRSGNASSQVIVHFLKLGSQRERQEKEKLEEEVKLLRAKTSTRNSRPDISALCRSNKGFQVVHRC